MNEGRSPQKDYILVDYRNHMTGIFLFEYGTSLISWGIGAREGNYSLVDGFLQDRQIDSLFTEQYRLMEKGKLISLLV